VRPAISEIPVLWLTHLTGFLGRLEQALILRFSKREKKVCKFVFT